MNIVIARLTNELGHKVFEEDLRRMTFPMEKCRENQCKCDKKCKIHFRELKIYEITYPDEAEKFVGPFLDSWIGTKLSLKQQIAKYPLYHKLKAVLLYPFILLRRTIIAKGLHPRLSAEKEFRREAQLDTRTLVLGKHVDDEVYFTCGHCKGNRKVSYT